MDEKTRAVLKGLNEAVIALTKAVENLRQEARVPQHSSIDAWVDKTWQTLEECEGLLTQRTTSSHSPYDLSKTRNKGR